ncbi:MAG: hypothetical protein EON59_01995 [Alphaproteobacteria bacterium]|nr:MAG: hypothetical protein EON59_01995 [Alphaproteobacteria bacterium]
MILAVTDHDDATSSNAAVCAILHDPAEPQVLGGALIGQSLLALLAANVGQPALFVGHGQADACIGNDRQSVLSSHDAHVLSGRIFFAIACHTASELGQVVAGSGGVWCGFVGEINCLPSDPDVIQEFQRVLIYVRDHIASLTSVPQAQAFVADYEAILGSIETFLDLGAFGMEPYLAVNLLRERLRVWITGTPNPLKCSKASDAVTRF